MLSGQRGCVTWPGDLGRLTSSHAAYAEIEYFHSIQVPVNQHTCTRVNES